MKKILLLLGLVVGTTGCWLFGDKDDTEGTDKEVTTGSGTEVAEAEQKVKAAEEALAAAKEAADEAKTAAEAEGADAVTKNAVAEAEQKVKAAEEALAAAKEAADEAKTAADISSGQ